MKDRRWEADLEETELNVDIETKITQIEFSSITSNLTNPSDYPSHLIFDQNVTIIFTHFTMKVPILKNPYPAVPRALIHCHSPPIVHSLLLILKIPEVLTKLPTLRHSAPVTYVVRTSTRGHVVRLHDLLGYRFWGFPHQYHLLFV